MKTRLLVLAAAALLLLPAGGSARPTSHTTSSHTTSVAFATLTIDGAKFRLTGINLTPGSYAGALLAYRDYGRTVSRTARVNVIDGRIQTGDPFYQVPDDGHLTIAGSTHIFTSGVVPGRLVAELATTSGDLVDAETDINS